MPVETNGNGDLKNLLYFIIGQATSYVGDSVIPVTFAFAAISVVKSGTILSFVLLALWISRIVLVNVAGSCADRYKPITIMVCSDIVRFLTHLYLGFSFYFHFCRGVSLIVTAVVYGAATAFFNPASFKVLPTILNGTSIQRANSLLASARNLSLIMGPALATFLYSIGGVSVALWFDADTFFVSVTMLIQLSIRTTESEPSFQGSKIIKKPLMYSIKIFLKYPVVAYLCLLSCIIQFNISCVSIVGPLVSSEYWGSISRWAVLATATSLGALAGSVCMFVKQTKNPIKIIRIGYVCNLLTIIALGLPSTILLAAVLFVLAAFCTEIAGILHDTYILENVPEKFLGRISSLESGLTTSMIPLGIIVTNQAVRFLPVHTYALALSGVLVCMIGALCVMPRFAWIAAGKQSQEA